MTPGLAPANTSRKFDKLTVRETYAVTKCGVCPDCGSPLREGPHGGLNVNWLCVGARCGSGFNAMGPFGVERITDAGPKRPR